MKRFTFRSYCGEYFSPGYSDRHYKIKMKTFYMHLGFSALILFAIFEGAEAENSTTQTYDRHEERKLTPLELGMQPFFKMTNNFLGLIVPDSKADTAFYDMTHFFYEPYFKEYFMGIPVDENDISVGYSDFTEYIDNHWEQVCKDYIGFLLCVIIGVLFIIIMPIWGLCFCCCRCCCKTKAVRRGRRRDGCKRSCYGSIMLIINTLVLTGLICAFIHNELIRQQMSRDPDVESKPLLSVLEESLNGIEQYRDSALHDVSSLVNKSIHEVDVLVLSLNDIPKKAQEKLSEVTNADSILATATSLATRVESMDAELKVIQDKTDSLKISQDRLVGDLDTMKQNILNTCNGRCSSSIINRISGMDIQADFKKMDQIQSQKANIQRIVGYNLTSLVLQSKAEYDKVINMVDSKTTDGVTTVTNEANKLLSEVRESTNTVMDNIRQSLDFVRVRKKKKVPTATLR